MHSAGCSLPNMKERGLLLRLVLPASSPRPKQVLTPLGAREHTALRNRAWPPAS